MLICRRDLETIIRVMDRFGQTKDFDGVVIDYNKLECGYTLAINFGTMINDVVCRIHVDIDQDTLEND